MEIHVSSCVASRLIQKVVAVAKLPYRNSNWHHVCFYFCLTLSFCSHVKLVLSLCLTALVRPLPSVEPVRVSWGQEPPFHPWPSLDPRYTAVQQVCYAPKTHTCCLLLPSCHRCVCYCPPVLMTSLMPPIRPMCWSTPVASVSICLQVCFIY